MVYPRIAGAMPGTSRTTSSPNCRGYGDLLLGIVAPLPGLFVSSARVSTKPGQVHNPVYRSSQYGLTFQ